MSSLPSGAIVTLLVTLLAPTVWQAPAQPTPPALQRHEFVVRNFKTEIGIVLPEARLVYTTLGRLNAGGTNAILLPSHYMADINGYNWLIGSNADRVFNPSRDFLILTELFGNGRSSSPSNTPEPFHGPRFPVTTIRDNVEIVYRLLTQELQGQPSARGRRFLDGRGAGVPVGGQPPRLHGRDCRHVGNGEMLWPRLREARRADRGAHDRSDVASRRLRSSSDQRPRSVQHGLGRLALLAGMVAQGIVENDFSCGDDVRAVSGSGAAARSEPMRTTTFFRRGRGSATTSARRLALMAMSSGRCDRSRCASSTCRPKRISIFR